MKQEGIKSVIALVAGDVFGLSQKSYPVNQSNITHLSTTRINSEFALKDYVLSASQWRGVEKRFLQVESDILSPQPGGMK
jgi:hypothetical protein